MTGNEKLGVAAGAGAVAYGLKQWYAKKAWDVPTPMWLSVTAALTYGGWLAYKKFAK